MSASSHRSGAKPGTISIYFVREAVRLLETQNVPIEPLLERAGIPVKFFKEPLAERYLSSIRLEESALACARERPTPRVREALGRMSAKLIALRTMSIAVAAQLQNGELPNLEAALIKDLGNAFEREQIAVFRALGAELPECSDDYLSALANTTINSPSWTLRGGILRRTAG